MSQPRPSGADRARIALGHHLAILYTACGLVQPDRDDFARIIDDVLEAAAGLPAIPAGDAPSSAAACLTEAQLHDRWG